MIDAAVVRLNIELERQRERCRDIPQGNALSLWLAFPTKHTCFYCKMARHFQGTLFTLLKCLYCKGMVM